MSNKRLAIISITADPFSVLEKVFAKCKYLRKDEFDVMKEEKVEKISWLKLPGGATVDFTKPYSRGCSSPEPLQKCFFLW